MLLAAPARRADGSDTIAMATATVATLWGAMAGDPGHDRHCAMAWHSSIVATSSYLLPYSYILLDSTEENTLNIYLKLFHHTSTIKSSRSVSLSFLSPSILVKTCRRTVIRQFSTGYKTKTITAPHMSDQTSLLPHSPKINSSSGASGKCGGQRFQGPFLYVLLRSFLLNSSAKNLRIPRELPGAAITPIALIYIANSHKRM